MTTENKTIKTSMNINKELLRKFKIYCIGKGVSMTDKLNELIAKEIKNA